MRLTYSLGVGGMIIMFIWLFCLSMSSYIVEVDRKYKRLGFSGDHVCMWKLGSEESWALKNWCFWTAVLEKTLESPLNCKEIQLVHPKGDQPWVFLKAGTPILWPPHAKSWLIGKTDAGRDWGQEEKGTTEDEMAGWHHWLDGHESGWTPGVGDGQGGLGAASHGVAKSRTRLNDWSNLIWLELDVPQRLAGA